MDAVLISKCPAASTTIVLPFPPPEDCGQGVKLEIPEEGSGQSSEATGGAKQGNMLARKVIEEMRSLSRASAPPNGTDAAKREFFFSSISSHEKWRRKFDALFVCFFAVQDVAAKLHQIAQPTRGSVHTSAQLGITRVYQLAFIEKHWSAVQVVGSILA